MCGWWFNFFLHFCVYLHQRCGWPRGILVQFKLCKTKTYGFKFLVILLLCLPILVRFNWIDPRSYLKQGIKGGRILYQMITIALNIFYYLFNLCVTTHLCKVDSFRMLAFCLSVYSPFYSESLLLILSCSHVGKFDKGWCKTTISADIKVTSVWQFRFLQRSQDWWSYWTSAWTDYFGH